MTVRQQSGGRLGSDEKISGHTRAERGTMTSYFVSVRTNKRHHHHHQEIVLSIDKRGRLGAHHLGEGTRAHGGTPACSGGCNGNGGRRQENGIRGTTAIRDARNYQTNFPVQRGEQRQRSHRAIEHKNKSPHMLRARSGVDMGKEKRRKVGGEIQ